VNAPITRLFVLVIVLFAVLIGATAWWSVYTKDDLEANAFNRREALQQQRIRRGVIRAADGTVLARSEERTDKTFTRRYPTQGLFAHALGYSFARIGQAGLELSRSDELTGKKQELTSVFDELRGRQQEGDDLITTLDPAAQRIALDGLAGRKGSVVAIEPSTGAVRVMASNPGFDPAALRSIKTFEALNKDTNSPLFNRATQAGYAPGSTMKVVTATAAIDSGRYTPGSTVDGRNGKPVSGVPLNNFGKASFGPIDLTTALTKSVNTVWAEVAEKLGKATMERYMKRFGFFKAPPIDLPSFQLRASGVYRGQPPRLVSPTSDTVDIGRVGIGQEKLNVTPLQMAMVASAVANDGRLMKPHIMARAVDRDGRTTEKISPEEQAQVMKPDTARQVGEMMTKVVAEGSGTAAALKGIDVAGKTGTAEKNIAQRLNQPWFIAFAPTRDAKVAIAVTIESSIGGTGGEVAAPIAKRVLESLLK
jgi:peptidoglycan glycosyltransferase